MTQPYFISTALLILLGMAGEVVAQQQSEEEELAAIYGDKSEVSIATGNRQPIAKAPSSATVITALDIRAMGATDLTQVLESVPGLHVSRVSLGFSPKYIFRGLTSEFGPEVLILLNGFKTNTNFQGIPSFVVGQIPVANVSRIEIIRGPGSALYGADAFSGVINIITKGASEINGTEVGVRLGSFKSRDSWVQYGGKLGGIDIAAFLQIGKTDGQRRIVEQDFQSGLDAVFGTHASLAPGPVNTSSSSIDARIDLSRAEWRMRAGYQKRNNGTGSGVGQALDPSGILPEERYNFDFVYLKDNILPHLDVNFAVNYFQLNEYKANPDFRVLPPGAVLPGGIFPDGFIGNPGHKERHEQIALSALYTKFNAHKIRIGIGREIQDLFSVTERKNFTFDANGVAHPLPNGVVDATGNPDLVFLLPAKRGLTYGFIQDEWSLTKDWNLTAGIRHDRYSDFGTTTNPRLALVWDAAYNLVFKGLYGRAFRAPSFAEEGNINSPSNRGNANLQPERVKTTELAVLWQATPTLQANLTLFKYTQSNIIQYVTPPNQSSSQAQNRGDQTGHGFEAEFQWDVARNFRLTGNYSNQKSIDGATDQDAGLAPRNHIFIRADWRPAQYWQIGGTVNSVLDRKRQPGDLRKTVPNYTSIDLNVNREKLWGNWVFQASVKNLFNRDIREPSLAPGLIPNDLPQAGRAFSAQLVYTFK